ncbi:MAG: GDSL-type esterase/lipase family protein [Roseburia sp.]|nr:GDSL-type esterase/lipase family protein [Roseburia sp.]
MNPHKIFLTLFIASGIIFLLSLHTDAASALTVESPSVEFPTPTQTPVSNIEKKSWHMYRGERKKISLGKTEGTKSTMSLSNPSVASLSADGCITAKKCGMTELIIKNTDDSRIHQTKISIHVTYSRFFKNNKLQKKEITTKVRNKYLSDSGFIGNSVSLCLTHYMKTQEKGFMGSPLMLPVGCYNFNNDRRGDPRYRIHYRGKVCTAKEAIRKSGIKKVFICMGTNDLYLGVTGAYRAYVTYLQEIRRVNPKVIIYIEGTPPAYSQRGHITNKNINALNKKIKGYCQNQKDMYYIDINSVLKNKSTGKMNLRYSSDKYVHINYTGCRVWLNKICSYIDKQLLAEQTAEDAAITAKESGLKRDVTQANKLVNALKNSSFKKKLQKKYLH